MAQDDRPLTEPSPLPDVFADQVGRIERIGSCVRVIFAVPQGTLLFGDSMQVERAVVARLVLPAEAVPEIARQLLAGVTVDLAQGATAPSPHAVN